MNFWSKSINNFCINLVILKFEVPSGVCKEGPSRVHRRSLGSVKGPSRVCQGSIEGLLKVSRGPPGVRRISLRVNQEVSQDQLEVWQGVCSGSVWSIGANGDSSFESSMGTALQIETLKLISWSWSGVNQESVRCPSGVYQGSVRSLSGFHRESVRSWSGVHQESVRSPLGVR